MRAQRGQGRGLCQVQTAALETLDIFNVDDDGDDPVPSESVAAATYQPTNLD